MEIEGLGRISPPLGTIRLGGTTKLIVSPWAALGTDALLVATGATTFAVARPLGLRILGAAGAIWGTTAILLEVIKLIEESRPYQVEIIRQ